MKYYSLIHSNPKSWPEFFSRPYLASTLPPLRQVSLNLVDQALQSQFTIADTVVHEFKPVPYRLKFKLDYITNTSVGITTGRMGTGMAGSVSAIFGDMTGDNQIFTSLALNGEIYDFGGQVAYINQKRKLKWGDIVSRIPSYYGSVSYGIDSLNIGGQNYLVDRINLDYIRMFEDKASLFAYFPITQTRRFEFSGELDRYSYDQYITYYDAFGTAFGSDRRKMDAPEDFGLHKIDAAYVLDNSVFGMTGPVNGTRYRLEVGKYFGAFNFYSTLADFRRYFLLRPYTLAFRSYNIGMWGSGSDTDLLSPMYLGYPWLIRGYQRTDIYWSDMELSGNGVGIENFFGNKIFVANAELRIPFSGPKNISIIKSEISYVTTFFIIHILSSEGRATLCLTSERVRFSYLFFPPRVPFHFTRGY